MNETKFSLQLTLPALLRLLVLGALLLALPPHPVAAQALAPAACLDDQGSALIPQQPDTWVLVLNFNHQLSTTATTGCLIALLAHDPNPHYKEINCPLVHNDKQVAVGNGSANFDGRFWIECPTEPTQPSLTQFDLQATARFTQPGIYTIVEHPTIAWGATIDVDWQVTLTSRYGATTFQHMDPTITANQQTLILRSEVVKKRGLHVINGQPLHPEHLVEAFDFAPRPLRISGQGQIWSLSELIIDPPGVCCTRR